MNTDTTVNSESTMLPTAETIFTSPLFTFSIGPDEVPMTLHKELVSHYSPLLDRHMNGAMIEAADGAADLDDIDHSTFALFSEWLYGHHYENSCSLLLPEMTSLTIEHGVCDVGTRAWDYGLTPFKKRIKERKMRANGTWEARLTQGAVETQELSQGSKRYHVWRSFLSGMSCDLPPPPRTNATPSQSSDDDVLVFSKLFGFADRYRIDELRITSLQRMKERLAAFDCQEHQMDSLVQLINYTVDNTLAADTYAAGLRQTVFSFAVLVIEALMVNKHFQELQNLAPEINKELLSLVQKRLD